MKFLIVAFAMVLGAGVVVNTVDVTRSVDNALITNARLDEIARVEFPELVDFDGPLTFSYDPTSGLIVNGETSYSAAPSDATTLAIIDAITVTETRF